MLDYRKYLAAVFFAVVGGLIGIAGGGSDSDVSAGMAAGAMVSFLVLVAIERLRGPQAKSANPVAASVRSDAWPRVSVIAIVVSVIAAIASCFAIYLATETASDLRDTSARAYEVARQLNLLSKHLGPDDTIKKQENYPPGPWKEVDSWKRLRQDLTTEETEAILGKPASSRTEHDVLVWLYPNGAKAQFFQGRLISWLNPAK